MLSANMYMPPKSGIRTCENPDCKVTYKPINNRQKYCGRPCNEAMKQRRKLEKKNV